MGFERIVVTESGFLRVTEGSRDAVAGYVGDGALGVGDDFSALDVETFDFGEGAADELSYNSKYTAGIDCLSLAVERSVAHSVRVEITSIGIASTCISV